MLEVCRAALKSFESLGCVVEEVVPDHPLEAVWQAFIKIRAWQQGPGLAVFADDPAKRALLKPEAVYEVETGRKLSAFDVSAASAVRTAWSNAVAQLLRRYDYLVMPTSQLFPFDIGETWPHQIAGHQMQTYHEWMKATCLVTMSGCPSLAVPAGFSAQGLPMGLQIVAPNHHEMDCLKLAFAYEQATEWTTRHLPPLVG